MPGMYLIEVAVKTSNNEFFLKTISKPIIVKRVSESIVLRETNPPNMYLQFSSNFTQLTEQSDVIKAIIYNSFISKYNLTLTRAISLYDGNMANLAIQVSSNAAKLENEWKDGFVLIDNVNLVKVTILDLNFDVKTLSVSQSVESSSSIKSSSSKLYTVRNYSFNFIKN